MKPVNKVWHDPVWSVVIATAIISILGVMLTTVLGAWPTVWAGIKSIFIWLGETSPVYNWLWLLGAAILLVVITLILIEFINSRSSPAPISYLEYVQEVFEGVLWRWKYDSGQPLLLFAFCARCDFQIRAMDAAAYRVVPRTQYLCEDCGHSVEIEGTPSEIESRVMRRIHKRLRNGTWSDVIEQALAEQGSQ